MSRNLGYTRKFIILRKDYSNMSNYNPKGHGKLELKGLRGNISISLENAEENNYYNVAFVGDNTMESIGKIYTEENGKGKAELVLNLQDLESKGFPMEKINGILILRDSNILLGGYIDKEDNSLEEFINSGVFENSAYEIVDSLNVEESMTVEPDVSNEELPQVEWIESEEHEKIDTVEEVVIVETEPITEEDISIYHVEAKQPTYEPLIEVEPDIVQSEEEPEPVIQSVEEPEPVVQSYEEETGDEIDYDYIKLEYDRRITQRNQTTNYILSILRFFPYVDPFTISLQGYNWWKIDYQEGIEERGFLPYFSYLVGGDQKYMRSGNVTAKDLLIKYEHYIFGLYNVKDEVKYYVYGVPGNFTKYEHPHRGATGFNTWFEGYEIEGYWLLYIDPLSGKVIYPANPMEPAK